MLVSTKHILDKGLVSGIFREFPKLNSVKTNNPIRKWSKSRNGRFTRKDTQMTNGYMKKTACGIIGHLGNATKTTARHPYTPHQDTQNKKE